MAGYGLSWASAPTPPILPVGDGVLDVPRPPFYR